MKIFLSLILLLVLVVIALIFYAKSKALSASVFPPQRILSWPQFVVADATPSSHLKIVTWNMGYASGDLNNQGNVLSRAQVEAHLQTIAAELQKLNPDIVNLQEVDFAATRTYGINQLEYLANALKMPYAATVVLWNKKYVPYPYWPPAKHFGTVVSGQAVLSRFPITHQSIRPLPMPDKPFWYNWFYLDRVIQRLRVDWKGVALDLWNVHLEAFDGLTRYEQAGLLADDVLASSASCKILAGDFNDPTTEAGCGVVGQADANALVHFENLSGLRVDDSHFADAPLTFPSVEPVDKLDHVAASKNFVFKNRQVICTNASDHCLVFVEMEVLR